MGAESWKVAFMKGTTWGTAGSAPGTNSLQRLLRESLPQETPTKVLDKAIGDAFPGDAYGTTLDFGEASFDIIARYEGLERLLAYVIGADTVTVASTKNNHTMEPATRLTYFGTIYVDKGVGSQYRYRSAKLIGFELKVNEGIVEVSYTVLTDKIERGTYSFASATAVTEALGILLNDLKFRINTYTPGADVALASPTDDIPISGFTFRFKRAMEGDHTNKTDGSIDEPQETDQPECSFEFTAPILTTALDTLITDAQVLSASGVTRYKKADLVFTGPANGAATRSLTLWLPRLVFSEAPSASAGGAGQKVPVTCKFTCLRAAVAPAGMVGVGNVPFRAVVAGSDLATSPLA